MAVTGQGRRKSVTIIPQTATPLFDAFTFDLTTSMRVTYPGVAATHPVQSGVEGITDAVIIDPPVISVAGVLANTPVNQLSSFISFPSFAFVTGDRMITLLELLLKIRAAKVRVKVLSSWNRPFANYWPEVVETERNQSSGNTIGSTVNFKKIRTVVTGIIPAVQDSDILALGQSTVEFGPVAVE